MKKIISILLTLCLLTGLCGFAAAEEETEVLEFPYTGFTFTVPEFILNLPGMLYSISDYGETEFGSGIFYGSAIYLPRTDEENDALYQILGASFCDENAALSDAELLIGKRGLADPAQYRSLAQRQSLSLRRRIEGVEKGDSAEKRRVLPWLRAILAEMDEIGRSNE